MIAARRSLPLSQIRFFDFNDVGERGLTPVKIGLNL